MTASGGVRGLLTCGTTTRDSNRAHPERQFPGGDCIKTDGSAKPRASGFYGTRSPAVVTSHRPQPSQLRTRTSTSSSTSTLHSVRVHPEEHHEFPDDEPDEEDANDLWAEDEARLWGYPWQNKQYKYDAMIGCLCLAFVGHVPLLALTWADVGPKLAGDQMALVICMFLWVGVAFFPLYFPRQISLATWRTFVTCTSIGGLLLIGVMSDSCFDAMQADAAGASTTCRVLFVDGTITSSVACGSMLAVRITVRFLHIDFKRAAWIVAVNYGVMVYVSVVVVSHGDWAFVHLGNLVVTAIIYTYFVGMALQGLKQEELKHKEEFLKSRERMKQHNNKQQQWQQLETELVRSFPILVVSSFLWVWPLTII